MTNVSSMIWGVADRRFCIKEVSAMKAMVIEEFGAPSVFKEADIPKPQIIPGHVLIKVAASSVNPIDGRIRRGEVPASAPPFPAVLHGDVAGVVDEVGEGVSAFKVGDEVFGLAGGTKGTAGGALADYLLADADFLAVKPQNINMAQAAALPLVCLAAWQSLFDKGKVADGESVLIHAAAGGVGHVALQLAKWAGAKVFATASPEKLSIGRELGADGVIDYTRQAVRDYVKEHTGGRGFDTVFDTVGGANLEKSFEAARPGGQVLAIATRSMHDLTLMNNKGMSLHVVNTMYPLVSGRGRAHYGEIISRISRLVEKGLLRPLLDEKTFSFREAGAAHSYLESGRALGKVVLINGG